MLVKRDFLYTPKGVNRRLHIYLPNDYLTSDARYPVLYCFDGHNLFRNEDATYGKSWGFRKFLEGWDQPLMVVGVECGHQGQERLSEYLPYPAIASSPFSAFEPTGKATMDWLVGEVKPFIDRTYRTKPGRESTGICGSSMGGLMAIFGGAQYNDVFSKAACVSSAIGFCMQPLMNALRQCDLSPASRFYLSWGTKEAYGLEDPTVEDRTSHTYRWNLLVAQAIQEKGAQAMLHCQVGGGHCEADWEQLIPVFLPYLFQSSDQPLSSF